MGETAARTHTEHDDDRSEPFPLSLSFLFSQHPFHSDGGRRALKREKCVYEREGGARKKPKGGPKLSVSGKKMPFKNRVMSAEEGV